MSNYRHLQTIEQSQDQAVESWVRENYHRPMPAFVESFDKDSKTISATIPISEYRESDQDEPQELAWPKLEDIPVLFPGGGPITITWPLKQGDPVLLIPCGSDLSEWFVSDGKEPVSPDLYNISDGSWFAIPRLYPEKKNEGNADGINLVIECGDVEFQVDTSKVRLGSLDAAKALAKAEETQSALDELKTTVNLIIAAATAAGGLVLPPPSPILSVFNIASTKVFTDS